MKERIDRIVTALIRLTDRGVVSNWYVSSQNGRRWVVNTTSGINRTYSTAEVEAFINGARAGLEAL